MNDQQRTNLARLRQLLDDPASDYRAIADSYIQVIGVQLIELGQRGFARDGRGAIEVDLRGIDLRSAVGGLPIAYYPAADHGDEWPEAVFGELQRYDPQRETIVILFHDQGEPLLYVLE